jgi:predicted PolB exonuclease-like 3'-5' exonuclease
MVCIFDCETIPDIELIRREFDVEGLDDLEATKKAQDIFASKNGGSTFLPLPFHKVVAISAVIGDRAGRFKKVGDFGEGSSDEKNIIAHFFQFIESKNPRVVSFNGRGFDMPMLLIRALKYNLSFPAWFDSSNPAFKKSKWENYRQRYSEEFHLDLMDTLSSFGAVRNINLNLLCSMADLPGKYDVDGSQVVDLYYQGKIEKIREYCQSDVLNTYLLFLKYELLNGNLAIKDYYSFLDSMREALPKEMGYYEIFHQFLTQELEKAPKKDEES